MKLYSPWGKQQDWARHFVPFLFKDGGEGKGLGWISKSFRCHLSIRWDCATRTVAIKDLHNLNIGDKRNLDALRQRRREARNWSSHACLPKRTTLYVRGRGDPASAAEHVAKGLSLLKPAQLPVLVYSIQFMYIAQIPNKCRMKAPHRNKS